MGATEEATVEVYPDRHTPPEGAAETISSEGRDNGHWPSVDDAARDRLVADHIRLVHRLCRRFADSGEPLEDLGQVGSVGLVKAARKFDPSRGINFITYAVPVIVGEIKNYLRDHGWGVKVPRKLQRNKLVVQRTVEGLAHTLARIHRRTPMDGVRKAEGG